MEVCVWLHEITYSGCHNDIPNADLTLQLIPLFFFLVGSGYARLPHSRPRPHMHATKLRKPVIRCCEVSECVDHWFKLIAYKCDLPCSTRIRYIRRP